MTNLNEVSLQDFSVIDWHFKGATTIGATTPSKKTLIVLTISHSVQSLVLPSNFAINLLISNA
jgi:hypothetical protein